MFRTFIIPLAAIAGVIFAVVTVVKGSRPPPATPPVIEPPTSPYENFIAGAGLVEASTQNIAIGTPVPGIAAKVEVTVGQTVKAGDVLFRLDAREMEAELAVRTAAVHSAESELARLRSFPRPETIPPAEAKVAEARASLEDAKAALETITSVNDPRAVIVDEVNRRKFAVQSAEARLAQAQADLSLLKAGSWSSEIAVSEAKLLQARSQADQTRTELERRIVRAPVDGQVLQVNLRAGEYAQAGSLATPLMLMGRVDPLHIRVDIDEHEAWRVKSGAKAVAFVRGNKAIQVELRYVRTEPYIIPKRSLTGESTERVDTRVLQLIYAFDRAEKPIFVGQQMDVYIQSDVELPTSAREATPVARN
ncbi:MAG: biotin/lipoyl-binding protein [Planctomycetota bacterium]|nr:biotin/lipoyl-binding protein [Planctomycetota bacterium]